MKSNTKTSSKYKYLMLLYMFLATGIVSTLILRYTSNIAILWFSSFLNLPLNIILVVLALLLLKQIPKFTKSTYLLMIFYFLIINLQPYIQNTLLREFRLSTGTYLYSFYINSIFPFLLIVTACIIFKARFKLVYIILFIFSYLAIFGLKFFWAYAFDIQEFIYILTFIGLSLAELFVLQQLILKNGVVKSLYIHGVVSILGLLLSLLIYKPDFSELLLFDFNKFLLVSLIPLFLLMLVNGITLLLQFKILNKIRLTEYGVMLNLGYPFLILNYILSIIINGYGSFALDIIQWLALITLIILVVWEEFKSQNSRNK